MGTHSPGRAAARPNVQTASAARRARRLRRVAGVTVALATATQAAGVLAASSAAAAGDLVPAAATSPTGYAGNTSLSEGTLGSDLSALRQCESSGNYATDTGNGFYGAYQFNLATWQSLGYAGYPNQAAPATQDAAAAALEQQRGWEPWPACSAVLGLTAVSGPAVVEAPAVVAASVTTPVTVSAESVTATPASATDPDADGDVDAATPAFPAFPGTVFTTALINQSRPDVARWQARMAQRGWDIRVDGYFGPQSAAVARAFTLQKGIPTAFPGQVDSAVWQAAWTLPVTP